MQLVRENSVHNWGKTTHHQTTQNQSSPQLIREKIISLIREAEKTNGIELNVLINNLKGFPPESINHEIQKFLEEGIIFEPSPGKLRWLG